MSSNRSQQNPDAPSSSHDSGRGNSGEGKDPDEGLYPATAENRPGERDTDSGKASREQGKSSGNGPTQEKSAS